MPCQAGAAALSGRDPKMDKLALASYDHRALIFPLVAQDTQIAGYRNTIGIHVVGVERDVDCALVVVVILR